MVDEVVAASKRLGRSPLQLLINNLLDAAKTPEVPDANGALEPSLNRLADCLLSVRDDPAVRSDGAHSYDETLSRIQEDAYTVLGEHNATYARAWSRAAEAVGGVREHDLFVYDRRYGSRVFTEQELEALARADDAVLEPIVGIARHLFADAYDNAREDRNAA